jgi:hypothetical protein
MAIELKEKKFSCFGQALYFSRKINTPHPEISQTDIFGRVERALEKLEREDQKTLVFRVRDEVMEGKCEIGALFAVARKAKMLAVAVSTVAVRKTGLTFSGLQEIGIAKIKENGKGKYAVYDTGVENLRKAAGKLREQGKYKEALFLEDYVSNRERHKIIR